MILQPTLNPVRESGLAASLKSIAIGSVGTVLTAAFLITLLPLESVLTAVPWIIGFTGALTGFRCVEMTKRNETGNARPAATLSGAVSGLCAWLLLSGMGFHLTGFPLLTLADLFIYTSLSAITGCLGGHLALRYYKL